MSLTRGRSAATVFAEYACTTPLATSTRSAWTSLHRVSLRSPRHSTGLFGGCKHFQNGHPGKAVRKGRESGHQASRSWFRKNTLQPPPASSGPETLPQERAREALLPQLLLVLGKTGGLTSSCPILCRERLSSPAWHRLPSSPLRITMIIRTETNLPSICPASS